MGDGTDHPAQQSGVRRRAVVTPLTGTGGAVSAATRSHFGPAHGTDGRVSVAYWVGADPSASAIISLHNRTHSSQMKIPPGPAISRCTRSRPFPQNEHAFGVRLLAIAKPLHRRIVVGAECWPRGTTVSPGRPHFLTNGLIQPAQHIQDLRRVLAELDVD